MCEGAASEEAMSVDLDNLLHKLGFMPDENVHPSQVTCEGLKILRRMLYRRACAFKPTSTQQQVLSDAFMLPYYYNSYVSLTHCHIVSFRRQLAETKSAGTLTHNMYMQNRLREIMAELQSAHSTQSRDRCSELVNELKQLVAHDTGGAIPEARTLMQICKNMSDLVVRESNEQGRSAAKHQAQLPTNICSGSGASPAQQAGLTAALTAAEEPQCAFCNLQGGRFSRCGKCMSVLYCSRECQVAHWAEHKVVCKSHVG